MRKIRFFINLTKEENWLNARLREGYLLTFKTGNIYTFTETERREGNICMDYRSFHKEVDYEDYIALFEDAGWQRLAGSRFVTQHYFINYNPTASQSIFSDKRSQLARYTRMQQAFLLPLLICLPMLITFSDNLPTSLNHLDTLYLTPGLWQMQGWAFLRSFLFETPFVIFRLFPYFLVPILLLTLYLITRAKRQEALQS